jgi:hypothetical protein
MVPIGTIPGLSSSLCLPPFIVTLLTRCLYARTSLGQHLACHIIARAFFQIDHQPLHIKIVGVGRCDCQHSLFKRFDMSGAFCSLIVMRVRITDRFALKPLAESA